MLMKNQIKDFATNYHLNEEIVIVSDFKNLKKKNITCFFLQKLKSKKQKKRLKSKKHST